MERVYFFHSSEMALFRTITRTFGVRCNTRSFSRLVDFFHPSISNVFLYFFNSDFSKYINGTVPLTAFNCG